jgi:hypothetical protein
VVGQVGLPALLRRVHATGTFDQMTPPLRTVPRWLGSSFADVVVEAVLHPVGQAR